MTVGKKYALCPLCNDMHRIYGDYWLIPSNPLPVNGVRGSIHEGYQTEFYCRIEYSCVVKLYSPDYKYIGYYIADEIPF